MIMMFHQITKVNSFEEMQFGENINIFQKAKVFYFIECLKYLTLKFEEEFYPIYLKKSINYKNKVTFKEFLL